MSAISRIDVRVYYENTDASGIWRHFGLAQPNPNGALWAE
jgi:acyl-CoA thioesterase FadM